VVRLTVFLGCGVIGREGNWHEVCNVKGKAAIMPKNHKRLEAITMAKAIITKTNVETESVIFEVPELGKALHTTLVGLSQHILIRLALQGLRKKVGDGAALSCDTVTGKSASIQDKFNAMDRIYMGLCEGNWGVIRDGGTAEPKGGYLFNALCELYAGKKTSEEIKTFLSGKDKKAQAALREKAKVKVIIDRMKSEIAKDIDTVSLLEELED